MSPVDMDIPEVEAASLLEEHRDATVADPKTSRKVLALWAIGGSLGVAACGVTLMGRGGGAASANRLEFTNFAGDTNYSLCSWGQDNCTATRCCNNPGHQCYYQNEKTNYAQCRESCLAKAPDPTHWDGEEWKCTELGERSAGEQKCSGAGEDCSKSMCCSEPGAQCYEKVEGWATCKQWCAADAPDLGDLDSQHWSCKELGPRALQAAPWVPSQCSKEGEDCRSSKCCADLGAQCYDQNADWAACRYECTPGKDPNRDWEPEWSCDEIGTRTPGAPQAQTSVVSAWVKDECSWPGSDCSSSRCCLGMNNQCYQKDENWATCMESCTPGRNLFDNNDTWSCQELGVRSQGLAVKGSPSLYCWSLFQTTTYENDIMMFQMNAGYGIFQCDGYSLLSTDEEKVMGKDVEGREVKTLHVKKAEITTSQDGTAGNAVLFINTWNVVVSTGLWNLHAWTIKVDPDAVIIPDRTRQHLAPYNLENVYVVNCNKFPSSPNFPMMYGSLEIFSWRAIQTYANNMGSCMDEMSSMLPLWGEDYFMTHCLDHIGVGRISDFASVGDDVCMGANCGDAWVGAFHPFKDVGSWKQCWNTAHGVVEV